MGRTEASEVLRAREGAALQLGQFSADQRGVCEMARAHDAIIPLAHDVHRLVGFADMQSDIGITIEKNL